MGSRFNCLVLLMFMLMVDLCSFTLFCALTLLKRSNVNVVYFIFVKQAEVMEEFFPLKEFSLKVTSVKCYSKHNPAKYFYNQKSAFVSF